MIDDSTAIAASLHVHLCLLYICMYCMRVCRFLSGVDWSVVLLLLLALLHVGIPLGAMLLYRFVCTIMLLAPPSNWYMCLHFLLLSRYVINVAKRSI